MSDEVKMALDEATDAMAKAIDHLEFELNKIRAGKASPSMLDGVRVDYYGTPTPLKNVANVNTPDARTITVQAHVHKFNFKYKYTYSYNYTCKYTREYTYTYKYTRKYKCK